MTGLLGFRKRIWTMLGQGVSNTPTSTTASESTATQGTKRRQSCSQQRELDSDLRSVKQLKSNQVKSKKQTLNTAESIESHLKDPKINTWRVKQESQDEPFDMLQQSIEFDDLQATVKFESAEEPEVDSENQEGSETEQEDEVEHDDIENFLEHEQVNESSFEEAKLEFVEHATAEDADFQSWSEQELTFFNRLNDRGIEPMLWSYWKMDLPMLPHSLFSQEKEASVIKNYHASAGYGARAFNELIQCGQFARERKKSGLDAAQLLARRINAYIKWSFIDSRLKSECYIPLLVVNHVRPKESLEKADQRTRAEVEHCADQYWKLWEDSVPEFEIPSPTIFYILIAKTVMGFGSYDTSSDQPQFRNIFFTNWNEKGQDLWNAMAIALLVAQTRSWLMENAPRVKVREEVIEIDEDL